MNFKDGTFEVIIEMEDSLKEQICRKDSWNTGSQLSMSPVIDRIKGFSDIKRRKVSMKVDQ